MFLQVPLLISCFQGEKSSAYAMQNKDDQGY